MSTPVNMPAMVVHADGVHWSIGCLNATAPENMLLIFCTIVTSHVFRDLENKKQLLNIEAMVVTAPVDQLANV